MRFEYKNKVNKALTMHFTEDDCSKDYTWSSSNPTPSYYTFDDTILNTSIGNEVLQFANHFLKCYIPKSGVYQLHKLEELLSYTTPYTINRRMAAIWLIEIWELDMIDT